LPAWQRDAYCAEAAKVALALGARDHEIPRTWAALRAYLDATYASGSIAVSAQARELGKVVLSPPFGWAIAPLVWSNRLVGAGFLPEHIRTQYGFDWSADRERRLQRNPFDDTNRPPHIAGSHRTLA
jgi:uncharacterized protein (DUF2236 family)